MAKSKKRYNKNRSINKKKKGSRLQRGGSGALKRQPWMPPPPKGFHSRHTTQPGSRKTPSRSPNSIRTPVGKMAIKLFEIFNEPMSGTLKASQLFKVMFRTKISLDMLRKFWSMVDKQKKWALPLDQVAIFLGLVSIYQTKHVIPEIKEGVVEPNITLDTPVPELGLDQPDTLCQMKLKEMNKTLRTIEGFVEGHETFSYYKNLENDVKSLITQFYEELSEEVSEDREVKNLEIDLSGLSLEHNPNEKEEDEKRKELKEAKKKAIGRYIETKGGFNDFNRSGIYIIINEIESIILEKIKKEISDLRDITSVYFPGCKDDLKDRDDTKNPATNKTIDTYSPYIDKSSNYKINYERFGKPPAELWLQKLFDPTFDWYKDPTYSRKGEPEEFRESPRWGPHPPQFLR